MTPEAPNGKSAKIRNRNPHTNLLLPKHRDGENNQYRQNNADAACNPKNFFLWPHLLIIKKTKKLKMSIVMGLEMERVRFLNDGIIRTEQHYLNSVLEVRRLTNLYYNYKIQIVTDISEFIVEENERVKNIYEFVWQDIIDSFEIMI